MNLLRIKDGCYVNKNYIVNIQKIHHPREKQGFYRITCRLNINYDTEYMDIDSDNFKNWIRDNI